MAATELDIALVVVDHDGGEMTVACLRHLIDADRVGQRLRIVLVDNGRRVHLDPSVVDPLPEGCVLDVITVDRNLGFAGGVDLALEHLGIGTPWAPTYIGLVNNDAFVERGWLAPLVEALSTGDRVGAACSKLLFEPRFTVVEVAAALEPRARGPALGVRVDGPAGSVFGPGFLEVRSGEWWTGQPSAVLFVPTGEPASLTLSATSSTEVAVQGMRLTAGPAPTTVDLALSTVAVDVLQNAGNELTPDWWVRDRLARTIDDGSAAAEDIWGWCGGAVLLRTDYLVDVGAFDRRFFLYWEDVELSWRGARNGWRYRFEPTSVVRHRHGASLGARSPLFELLNRRNRLVVVARLAGPRVTARVWGRELAEVVWFCWRDVIRAALRRQRPSVRRSAVRARSLLGALKILVSGRDSRLSADSPIRSVR